MNLDGKKINENFRVFYLNKMLGIYVFIFIFHINLSQENSETAFAGFQLRLTRAEDRQKSVSKRVVLYYEEDGVIL